ncbi:hypothetical protein SCYAM73S_05788 [Streptomyces cyaneofuscatus]
MQSLLPDATAIRQIARLPPRLWLTLKMSLAYWAYGGEVNRATRGRPSYEPGSRPTGLAPVGFAVTSTPARPSASISAVRPKAAGSAMGDTFRAGAEPAAMVPESWIRVPSPEVVTSMSVGSPGATVRTVDVTRYGETFGRQSSRAGAPGRAPGVVSRSMRLSLMISGVGVGSKTGSGRKSRSSTITSPSTRVMPDRRTCWASWSIPASGSCGVSVAPGKSLAYVWSRSV